MRLRLFGSHGCPTRLAEQVFTPRVQWLPPAAASVWSVRTPIVATTIAASTNPMRNIVLDFTTIPSEASIGYPRKGYAETTRRGRGVPKSAERGGYAPAASPSLGCVYTVVVSGLTCLANRCAGNRFLDAQYMLVTAVCRSPC